MINTDLRRQIDALWTEFWTGGITNPLTVIEQITYLLFLRMLDEAETTRERAAKRSGQPYQSQWFGKDDQDLRWSHLQHMSGNELMEIVRDRVFPYLRSLGDREGADGEARFMKDAQLMILKPALLSSAIAAISNMDISNTDAKGDLYEYLLSKISTAGINGQFRTPDHIRRAMVELLQPKPTDHIADPACGTAGFLIKVIEFLRKKYTSPEMIITGENGEPIYTGDLLKDHQDFINNEMFHGFDFDQTMLRVSAMNMFLHGITGNSIAYQDSLSETFSQNFPELAKDYFDIVLANPPFKGNVDKDTIAKELTSKVKTGKTELLFLVRILEMLKKGGRCAVIVPDGVLFGASKAHVSLRKMLIDDNQLDAVISLPSGVFKPYAGVSTAILVFTKGGTTENVFFFDVEADGFSLDDKRNPIEANDLPELLKRWVDRDPEKDTDRTSKAFFVPASEIRENNYDLSLNRYKRQVYVSEEYDPPLEIMAKLEELEKEIVKDMQELREMLG